MRLCARLTVAMPSLRRLRCGEAALTGPTGDRRDVSCRRGESRAATGAVASAAAAGQGQREARAGGGCRGISCPPCTGVPVFLWRTASPDRRHGVPVRLPPIPTCRACGHFSAPGPVPSWARRRGCVRLAAACSRGRGGAAAAGGNFRRRELRCFLPLSLRSPMQGLGLRLTAQAIECYSSFDARSGPKWIAFTGSPTT